jgi:hypothetical protein
MASTWGCQSSEKNTTQQFSPYENIFDDVLLIQNQEQSKCHKKKR